MQHRWVMVAALCVACGGERREAPVEPELAPTPTILESELPAHDCAEALIDTLLWRDAADCRLERYSAR